MTASSKLRALLTLGLVALGSSGALFAGCRKDAPGSAADGAGSAPPSGAAPAPSPSRDSFTAGEDAAERDAGSGAARAGQARRDAGGVDTPCEGGDLSLLAAAVDPRCAVSEREWRAMQEDSSAQVRDGGARAGGSATATGRGALRQEARRDGDHIVLSLVNGGTAPLVVPLRFHPGRPELAFTVLAESEQKAVFVLEPPSNDTPGEAPRIDAGAASVLRALGLGDFDRDVGLDAGSSFLRVHSARIRLAPGGAARARLAIDPRIAKRLDRSCGAASSGASSASRASSGSGLHDGGRDGGPEPACQPPRLPKGRVVLYVGQLVASVDAGAPARGGWVAP